MLKALGKENVDNVIISKLQSEIDDRERKAMLSEAQYVTAWIYEIIKKICR